MKSLVTIGLLVLVASVAAAAQNRLPNKPYTEWTEHEVTQFLFSSEWAQVSSHHGQGRTRDVPDYPPSTDYFVQLRLYSALPVRQAIVRRMQLTIPYAKLNPAQQASFDAEVDGLLKCPHCAEYYIVTVTSAKGDPLSLATRGDPRTVDAVERLKGVPEAEILQHVSLANDKGERRQAARAVFTRRQEIVLMFRRVDDQGNALITPAAKKFSVEFDDYVKKKTEGSLTKFTFNVAGITRNGEVLF